MVLLMPLKEKLFLKLSVVVRSPCKGKGMAASLEDDGGSNKDEEAKAEDEESADLLCSDDDGEIGHMFMLEDINRL